MRQSILVADPDTLALEAVEAAAAEFDAEVISADSVDEAFDIFIEKGPDVIFVDALLPRKGAFDLIKRVRQAAGGDSVAFFVTTSLRSSAALKEEAVSIWKAQDVFSKPLREEVLAFELDKVLAKPEARVIPATILSAAVCEEGGFERESFPLVFSHAMRLQEPCRLAVMQGKMRKVLYFKDGKLEFARSNAFGETLARYLLQRSLVTEEAYQIALQMVIDSGMKIGEAFLALGQIDRETLDSAIHRNILEKVFDLFTWRQGWYKIIPYEAPPADLPGGPVSCESVLWTVVIEQVNARVLAEAISRNTDRVLVAARTAAELPGEEMVGEASGELAAMFDVLDGVEISEAMQGPAGAKPEYLYYLMLTGFLRFEDEGAAGGAILDPTARKRMEEVEQALEWMRGRNFFQIMGVGLDATGEEIEKSYSRLGEKFSEDTIPAGAPSALKRALSEARELVGQAYQTLADPDSRSDYITTIKGTEEEQNEGAGALKAESVFREGIEELRKQNWTDATSRFREAVALNPMEPEYALYMGISRMHENTPTPEAALDDAERILTEAHRAAPGRAEPIYQLGQIAKRRGDMERALEFYEKTLRADPNHERAAKKKKMLITAAQKGKGVLGGIFSKT